jgi:hypothetical protein
MEKDLRSRTWIKTPLVIGLPIHFWSSMVTVPAARWKYPGPILSAFLPAFLPAPFPADP